MLCKRYKFFSGSAKQSAKGVTKDARRSMTHELYKRTLLGGEVVRLLNNRIASSNHRFHTITVNKKSLSCYDDKRFIFSDQVSTLPYGHSAIREDMFFRTIVNEPEWGADDLGESEQESGQQAQDSSQQAQESRQRSQDSSQQAQDSTQQAQGSTQPSQQRRKHNQQQKNKKPKQQPTTTIPKTSTLLNSSFNSLDPGFYQCDYSEDELGENLVDFDKMSELWDSGSSTDPACDGFILDQAIESDNASVSSENQGNLSATESKNRKQNAKKGGEKNQVLTL